jgi:hypothetical protein
MAKVVQLRGARPGGWAKDRWQWIGDVLAAPDLSHTAKLIGVALAQGFANHETAECRPGLKALMAAVSISRATVLRALADLQAAGWLEKRGGNAPGRLAAYGFLFPQQVSSLRPEQVSSLRPEQVSPVSATGLNPEISPCTPYKDKPHMNHRAREQTPRQAIRGLPQPQCPTTLILPGSVAAERWNDWLAANGFPGLDRIGFKVEGSYRMPLAGAPSRGEGDTPAARLALRWADWLRSKA